MASARSEKKDQFQIQLCQLDDLPYPHNLAGYLDRHHEYISGERMRNVKYCWVDRLQKIFLFNPEAQPFIAFADNPQSDNHRHFQFLYSTSRCPEDKGKIRQVNNIYKPLMGILEKEKFDAQAAWSSVNLIWKKNYPMETLGRKLSSSFVSLFSNKNGRLQIQKLSEEKNQCDNIIQFYFMLQNISFSSKDGQLLQFCVLAMIKKSHFFQPEFKKSVIHDHLRPLIQNSILGNPLSLSLCGLIANYLGSDDYEKEISKKMKLDFLG